MAALDAVGQLSGRNPLDSMAALINFVPVLMAWQHASHSVYTPPLGDFRGFAYVTVWPDGSRSDVAFLRGPDARRLFDETSAYVRSLLQVPPAPSQVALAKLAAEGTVVTPAHTYPLSLSQPLPAPSESTTTSTIATTTTEKDTEESVTTLPVPDDGEAVTSASSSPREDAFTPSEGSTEDPTSPTEVPATEATEAVETTTTA